MLTQQTVLGFSEHPPSPFGATHLPHCITEQRGGQQSFAMNQHTQLQFNLGVPPRPTNRATHFDPTNPSPVVIEKASFVCGEFRTISAEKLALAVRIAKRDLRLGRCRPPTPSGHACPCCRSQQSVASAIHCDSCDTRVRTREPQTPVRSDTGHTDTKKKVVEDGETPLPKRTPLLLNKLSVAVPEVSLSLVDTQGNQRPRESKEDHNSQEVLRLRKELQRQVTYIKQLRELKGCGLIRRHVTPSRRFDERRGHGRGVRGDSGRVWMEEARSEEEKRLQREEEQAVRNARTIYNLSHQLSRLQQDMQRLQLNKSTSGSKKVHTVFNKSHKCINIFQR